MAAAESRANKSIFRLASSRPFFSVLTRRQACRCHRRRPLPENIHRSKRHSMRWPMLKHTWSTRPTISEVIAWTPFTLLMKLIVSYASACSTDGNLDSARCPISVREVGYCVQLFTHLALRTYCAGSFDRTPRFKHEHRCWVGARESAS